MPPAAIAEVVDVWRGQTRELGARPEVRQVLCFENKGDVVGVSNPHPHGQIYATSFTWKTFDDRARRVGAPPARHRPRADGGHHPRRAAGRPPRAARGRARDRVRALLRPLRLRGLRRPQAARRARVRPERRRGGVARGRALRRDRPLRQPVAHVVPVRAGAAPGAHRRRRLRRVPLLHRVSSAAAPAAPCSSTWPGPRSAAATSCPTPSPEAKAAELRAQAPLHYKRA